MLNSPCPALLAERAVYLPSCGFAICCSDRRANDRCRGVLRGENVLFSGTSVVQHQVAMVDHVEFTKTIKKESCTTSTAAATGISSRC